MGECGGADGQLDFRGNEYIYENNKNIFGILSIVAGLAMTGRSQTYQFTIPISGYITMSAQDLTTGSSGVITNFFDTLSETLYLDMAGNTLRQVGTVSYNPSAPNIQFQETQAGASGAVTVTLGPTGGKISFDTGTSL